MSELADARRKDLLACHARIEQLGAALAEARLQLPGIGEAIPSTEFQPGLAFDEGLIDAPAGEASP